jgi:hypothetical protein
LLCAAFASLNIKDWNPDLIYRTGTQVYGTPSYYVQQTGARPSDKQHAVFSAAKIAPFWRHKLLALSNLRWP